MITAAIPTACALCRRPPRQTGFPGGPHRGQRRARTARARSSVGMHALAVGGGSLAIFSTRSRTGSTKRFFADLAQGSHLPAGVPDLQLRPRRRRPSLSAAARSGPTGEIAANPRARSGKLRVAKKIADERGADWSFLEQMRPPATSGARCEHGQLASPPRRRHRASKPARGVSLGQGWCRRRQRAHASANPKIRVIPSARPPERRKVAPPGKGVSRSQGQAPRRSPSPTPVARSGLQADSCRQSIGRQQCADDGRRKLARKFAWPAPTGDRRSRGRRRGRRRSGGRRARRI